MPVVLVVDDEPDIHTLMRINLEAAGYDVVAAAGGDEALALVRAAPPDGVQFDAVLLDIMMPGTDGWAVLATLKASGDRRATIPVFLVTALHGSELRLRSGIEGALRYITKPFDPFELVRALDEVLAPDAPAEPELRRRVQAASLEALARSERSARDDDAGTHRSVAPRVRLTRLEHAPIAPVPSPRVRQARQRLEVLTPKQRRLVEELATGVSVTAVAQALGTSRSNVYTSLRRIGRKLGLKGTNELLALLRQGALSSGEP